MKSDTFVLDSEMGSGGAEEYVVSGRGLVEAVVVLVA